MNECFFLNKKIGVMELRSICMTQEMENKHDKPAIEAFLFEVHECFSTNLNHPKSIFIN